MTILFGNGPQQRASGRDNIGASKTEAIGWAKKKIASLLKGGKYSKQAAFNLAYIESQRRFNIGAAHAIEKALGMMYRPDTEEEIKEWEEGKDIIKKTSGGYKVLSESGSKNLGGPYKSRAQAEKRLRQVEYFKHKG